MSAGPKAQIAALAILSVIVIALVFLIIVALNIRTGFSKPTVLFHELLETMDPGTVANFSSLSWPYTLLSVLITLYGIFVVGALIGILANAIDQRLQELRKGRSRVVEDGHIVVLGWSGQIFTLLREMTLANANQSRSAIVVMAPRDKVEMEDAIADKVPRHRATRIVCRTGNPLDVVDLQLVGLPTCRAVVVLTSDDEPDPDALVLKTLMAVTSATGDEPPPFRVFAELLDEANADVAALAGRGRVELVPSVTLSARIVAETASQPGLSAVFTDFLDYEGDEIYIASVPEVAGRPFGEALLAFEDSTPIGVLSAGGEVVINPSMERVVGEGDAVIAVSADDDTVVANGRPEVDPAAILDGAVHVARPTRILVLGENTQLPLIARELERRAGEGSVLVIASPGGGVAERLAGSLRRQRVSHRHATPTSRRDLEELDVESFDGVVILTDPGLPPEEADARTLTTLLHVRDLEQRSGRDIPVVSEMRIPENKALAEASTDYDYIVSTQLISLYISQVVMTPRLADVFRALLTGDESIVTLVPAGSCVTTGSAVNFYTVTEAARRRDAIAIGYRVVGAGASRDRIVLNPDKSEEVTFGPRDQLIVLASRDGRAAGSASGPAR